MFSQQTGNFPLYTCFVLAGVLAGVILYLSREKDASGKAAACVAVPLCALVGARALYVAFALDEFLYAYGLPAVFDLRCGGCMLYGGLFGGMLGGTLLAKARHMSVTRTLDSLVVPALAAIALCRLGEGFTTEGVGPMIENEALCFFPLAICNEYEEWNLCVFLLEALVALVLMVVFMKKRRAEAGETTCSALLLLSCSQILLENLRSDGCLRIGFVRVTEVIAALVVLAVIILRSRKMGKHLLLRRVVCTLLCVAGIGIIEWAQDKTNIPNLVLYVAMGALCAAMACIGSGKKERRA